MAVGQSIRFTVGGDAIYLAPQGGYEIVISQPVDGKPGESRRLELRFASGRAAQDFYDAFCKACDGIVP